eukprot:5680294-Prymnesium_polylepis.1
MLHVAAPRGRAGGAGDARACDDRARARVAASCRDRRVRKCFTVYGHALRAAHDAVERDARSVAQRAVTRVRSSTKRVAAVY